MNAQNLRIFTILSAIVLLSIIGVQTYWFRQAISLEDSDFDKRITAALRASTKRLLKFNNNPNNMVLKPVERILSSYYTVQINDVIKPDVLEEFLKQEFLRQDIKSNFEYGIYDCMKDRIQYGGYVCTSENCDSTNTMRYEFPMIENHNYYFGVYFPDRRQHLLNQMGFWFISSAILVVVIGFFGYALWVIFRQKRLSEIQTDFINNMTHEFKTPISTILISSDVLTKPSIVDSPERLLSYATIIKNEANRLKKHVDAVLNIAKITDTAGNNLNVERLDFHDIIHELIQNQAPTLQEKNATITLKLNAHHALIQGDRMHLSNVLHNLIDNASKYCEGSPRIEISSQNVDNQLIIKIKDYGLGIAERDIKLIFTKFYRVPTGNVHNVKGFGLGLYYVKMMVEAHKGKITAESKIGQGSTFTLSFLSTESLG